MPDISERQIPTEMKGFTRPERGVILCVCATIIVVLVSFLFSSNATSEQRKSENRAVEAEQGRREAERREADAVAKHKETLGVLEAIKRHEDTLKGPESLQDKMEKILSDNNKKDKEIQRIEQEKKDALQAAWDHLETEKKQADREKEKAVAAVQDQIKEAVQEEKDKWNKYIRELEEHVDRYEKYVWKKLAGKPERPKD